MLLQSEHCRNVLFWKEGSRAARLTDHCAAQLSIELSCYRLFRNVI